MKTSFTTSFARVLFSCTLFLITATGMLHAGNRNPAPTGEMATPPGCVANFNFSTDSNCVTHFVNTSLSASSNVTYAWFDLTTGFSQFSTQASPAHTFTSGSHYIALYMYVNGALCDSTTRMISVNCGNPGGGCNASFSYSTDSTCMTNFVNTSTGTNLTYQWYINAHYSTQANPSYALNPGYNHVVLYVYSNGQFCDSLDQQILVGNCGGNNGGCNANFTYSMTPATCSGYFMSISTGSNLTYQWITSNGQTSTSASTWLTLANGINYVTLYVYSNGQFCDSMSRVINANCGNNGGCNAGFTYSTDSTCMTNFVNTSTGTNLTYHWYIDNHYSTLTNPSYALNPGSHAVALYVYSNGQFCDSIGTYINVGNCNGNPGGGCHANFWTYADSSNCNTHFINTSSGAWSYQWFVNGQTSTQYNPVFNLPNGSYFAILLAYDVNGQICDSTGHMVYVNCGNGGGCTASFWTYADSTNCSTHFVNTSSGAWSYQWFVGGQTSTQYNPVFNLPNGTYFATLLAYDVNGQLCDTMGQVVYVNCNNTPPCQAGFQLFADSTHPGNYFAYNTSTGPAPISYLWNFGDGNTSTQAYPFHQYATPGNYIICLTITAGTCTSTYCDSTNQHKTSAMSSLTVMAGTTGVQESSFSGSIKAFPNPMSDELSLETLSNTYSDLRYVLVDALGRVAMNGNIEGANTTLHTASLPQGFYYLSVYHQDRLTKTIKLVK